MKNIRLIATALATVAALAGCGGSDPGDQTPRVQYTRMINFGDSLSDVGTYKTTALVNYSGGGGMYSINGNLSQAGLPYTNWTQYLAATLGLDQPCAAEVGLQSNNVLAYLAQAPAAKDGCYSYAEGGSRVTLQPGPGNAAFAAPPFNSSSGWLGQLTIPVHDQVQMYLADNGDAFTSTDLVTVLAGGNDLFIDRDVGLASQVGGILAQQAQGLLTQEEANAAIDAAATQTVAAMSLAGSELGDIVLNDIVAKGATHVVVVNLPDVSITPDAAHYAESPVGMAVMAVRPDITLEMVQAFNTALAGKLGVSANQSSHDEVLWVDAYTASQQQVADPAQFGLTNVTDPACDLTVTGVGTPYPAPNPTFIPLPTSLVCTTATLTTDEAHVTADDPTGVLHYEFADNVHPTPYGYKLLAQLVGANMAGKGWL